MVRMRESEYYLDDNYRWPVLVSGSIIVVKYLRGEKLYERGGVSNNLKILRGEKTRERTPS